MKTTFSILQYTPVATMGWAYIRGPLNHLWYFITRGPTVSKKNGWIAVTLAISEKFKMAAAMVAGS